LWVRGASCDNHSAKGVRRKGFAAANLESFSQGGKELKKHRENRRGDPCFEGINEEKTFFGVVIAAFFDGGLKGGCGRVGEEK